MIQVRAYPSDTLYGTFGEILRDDLDEEEDIPS